MFGWSLMFLNGLVMTRDEMMEFWRKLKWNRKVVEFWESEFLCAQSTTLGGCWPDTLQNLEQLRASLSFYLRDLCVSGRPSWLDVDRVHYLESNEWQFRSQSFFVVGRPPLEDVDRPHYRNTKWETCLPSFCSFDPCVCARPWRLGCRLDTLDLRQTWETDFSVFSSASS